MAHELSYYIVLIVSKLSPSISPSVSMWQRQLIAIINVYIRLVFDTSINVFNKDRSE